jgi:hypothetical protein
MGGWDPSLVTKKADAEKMDSSYSVETTGGITNLEPLKFDLVHLYRERGLSPATVVNKVRELHAWLKWEKLFFESNSFGALHLYRITDETNVPAMRHHTGTDKDSFHIGVPSMSVIFENVQVRLPYRTAEDRALTDLLISEFHGLGREKHDDIVMAFWIMVCGMNRYIDGLSNLERLTGERAHDLIGEDDVDEKTLSFVAKRAIAAVHQGDLVQCNQVQYMNEIRQALLDRRKWYADQNDVVRLHIVFQEIQRLDEKFSYKEDVDVD